MENNYRTKVGVGVMVFKDGKVLLGKRMSSHGDGEYFWPGGHMEHMESFEGCANFRVLRAAGALQISSVRLAGKTELNASLRQLGPPESCCRYAASVSLLISFK